MTDAPKKIFGLSNYKQWVWIISERISICPIHVVRYSLISILVTDPEKNRAAQNRASWGLYLCTKWDFFTKNRVSSRLLFKIRASWGYTYVLKGIFIDFFLAYLAIGTFFNWDLWTIETFKQLGIGMFGQLGPLAIGTFGQLEIVGSS